MTLNQNYLSENWGWYVDFETDNIIQLQQYNVKKLYNILEVIYEEDEYDYYKKNTKDLDIEELDIQELDIESRQEYKNKKIDDKKIQPHFVYKVISTTLITGLVSYIVYFVL